MAEREAFQELFDLDGASGPDELRRAYRQAALKHHPDRCGHSHESVQRFQQLTRAYRTARQRLARRGPPTRTYTPRDLAHRRFRATSPSFVRTARRGDNRWLQRLGGLKMTLPTLNEPLAFAAFWAVAVLVGTAGGGLTAAALLRGITHEELTLSHLLLVAGVTLLAYAAAVTAAVAGILLSRRVLWLVTSLALSAMRLLPKHTPPERIEKRT